MAAIGADHKPRAMLSDLSGRAIQWNDKTTKGLNARVRDNVSSKGPPTTKLVIEQVGKFVKGFSYGAQSTRAQLVYVLGASNTKASSRDLMRLEELLKRFQMDALILCS